MDPEPLREPSLNDLCCLTLLGNIAYAARCARRIQPRFQLPADAHDGDKMTAVVEASIRLAEGYVVQAVAQLDQAARLTELSLAVAEATSEETDYAAYAAYHAVRGVHLAAPCGEAAGDEAYLEIVASAYGASRVVLANVPIWVRNQLVTALRGDYDKLVQLGLGNPPQRGQVFNPTITGPLGALWSGDSPTW